MCLCFHLSLNEPKPGTTTHSLQTRSFAAGCGDPRPIGVSRSSRGHASAGERVNAPELPSPLLLPSQFLQVSLTESCEDKSVYHSTVWTDQLCPDISSAHLSLAHELHGISVFQCCLCAVQLEQPGPILEQSEPRHHANAICVQCANQKPSATSCAFWERRNLQVLRPRAVLRDPCVRPGPPVARVSRYGGSFPYESPSLQAWSSGLGECWSSLVKPDFQSEAHDFMFLDSRLQCCLCTVPIRMTDASTGVPCFDHLAAHFCSSCAAQESSVSYCSSRGHIEPQEVSGWLIVSRVLDVGFSLQGHVQVRDLSIQCACCLSPVLLPGGASPLEFFMPVCSSCTSRQPAQAYCRYVLWDPYVHAAHPVARIFVASSSCWPGGREVVFQCNLCDNLGQLCQHAGCGFARAKRLFLDGFVWARALGFTPGAFGADLRQPLVQPSPPWDAVQQGEKRRSPKVPLSLSCQATAVTSGPKRGMLSSLVLGDLQFSSPLQQSLSLTALTESSAAILDPRHRCASELETIHTKIDEARYLTPVSSSYTDVAQRLLEHALCGCGKGPTLASDPSFEVQDFVKACGRVIAQGGDEEVQVGMHQACNFCPQCILRWHAMQRQAASRGKSRLAFNVSGPRFFRDVCDGDLGQLNTRRGALDNVKVCLWLFPELNCHSVADDGTVSGVPSLSHCISRKTRRRRNRRARLDALIQPPRFPRGAPRTQEEEVFSGWRCKRQEEVGPLARGPGGPHRLDRNICRPNPCPSRLQGGLNPNLHDFLLASNPGVRPDGCTWDTAGSNSDGAGQETPKGLLSDLKQAVLAGDSAPTLLKNWSSAVTSWRAPSVGRPLSLLLKPRRMFPSMLRVGIRRCLSEPCGTKAAG